MKASVAKSRRIVLRHGAGPMAFQLLAPTIQRWIHDETLIGYGAGLGYRVIAAGPVGPRGALAGACRRFIEESRHLGHRVCFFGAERELLAVLERAGFCGSARKIGEQPEWDPRTFSRDGAGFAGLRYQLGRAARHGVRVRRAEPAELIGGPLHRPADEILRSWLAARALAPLGFVATPSPFIHAEHRRFFVAHTGTELIGLSSLAPVPARRGWFVEHLLRRLDAPNGMAELLISAALDDCRARGERYFTLGLAPLAGAKGRDLQLSYAHLSWLYNFAGLHRFKAKLKPQRWRDLFLITLDGPGPLALWACLAAFADGDPIGFALRSLLKLARQHPLSRRLR